MRQLVFIDNEYKSNLYGGNIEDNVYIVQWKNALLWTLFSHEYNKLKKESIDNKDIRKNFYNILNDRLEKEYWITVYHADVLMQNHIFNS